MQQIDNYPNYYITKEGEIFSKRGKLSPSKTKEGYLQLILSQDGIRKHFYVHRLVAQAFIPNPNNLPQVNHKDFNKTNNHVSNLEWLSGKDNTLYSWNNGRCEHSRKMASLTGKKYGGKNIIKRPVRCIDNGMIFESLAEAAKWAGLASRSSIYRSIHMGIKAKGFKWKYI